MALKLPAVALSLLKVAKGAVDPARRGTKAHLSAVCKTLAYPLHPSVVTFEAAFGGLVIANESKGKKGGPVWLFGAHACLTSGAHVAPRGGSKQRGLVPVAYSPNDVIYFLDKQGRAFAQDTIEDTEATPFADDGTALVTRVLLYSALFALGDSAQAHPGLVGAELAKRLSLTLVKEASGRDLRFFSDAAGKTLVIENIAGGETLVASADKKLLRALEQSEAKEKSTAKAATATKRAKPRAKTPKPPAKTAKRRAKRPVG